MYAQQQRSVILEPGDGFSGTWLLVSWTGNALPYSLFGKYVRQARKAVGLGWTIHDLRHLGVSVWIADGADRFLVMEAAGHSKIATTVSLRASVAQDVPTLADRVDQLDEEALRDVHVPLAGRAFSDATDVG